MFTANRELHAKLVVINAHILQAHPGLIIGAIWCDGYPSRQHEKHPFLQPLLLFNVKCLKKNSRQQLVQSLSYVAWIVGITDDLFGIVRMRSLPSCCTTRCLCMPCCSPASARSPPAPTTVTAILTKTGPGGLFRRNRSLHPRAEGGSQVACRWS